MDEYSIDIVVPTYRLDETILLGIIHLPRPAGYLVSVYIIADNPVAVIPESIRELDRAGSIKLIINPRNLGVSATRNAGIRAGSGHWVLLLDDDITPEENLLIAYAAAIGKKKDAIGFAGITRFPPPVNAVTRALHITGETAAFTAAASHATLPWAPTANILLCRGKMDEALFDEQMATAEDIDFLVRNSLHRQERYTAVPEAVVHHPWWNNGKVQTARMLRYGIGVSQLARKAPARDYTFRDFTNTSETILLLLLLLPFAYAAGLAKWLWLLLPALLLAELLTNWLKGIMVGKTTDPAVAFHMMWAKNCREAAGLYQSLKTGFLNGFALRVEMGFVKPHPRPFRTNRWKIIKMLLLAVLFLIAVITF